MDKQGYVTLWENNYRITIFLGDFLDDWYDHSLTYNDPPSHHGMMNNIWTRQ